MLGAANALDLRPDDEFKQIGPLRFGIGTHHAHESEQFTTFCS